MIIPKNMKHWIKEDFSDFPLKILEDYEEIEVESERLKTKDKKKIELNKQNQELDLKEARKIIIDAAKRIKEEQEQSSKSMLDCHTQGIIKYVRSAFAVNLLFLTCFLTHSCLGVELPFWPTNSYLF